MKISDENVVRQIQLKNEEALDYLVITYGGLLNGIIRKYLISHNQDIEECFADVLVSIWFNINSFDPSKNEFKQWIAAIAKYRAIDYFRKLNHVKKHISTTEINDRLLNEPISIHNSDLAILLNELNDTEKAIFNKYYVEGIPTEEIANELQVKPSWIHNKLSRGRKKLKNILLKGEV
ncbi:sigma-70 family RNA polymerase sigma factor [Solibacillus daqui]|uniref:sigma-70 family RNA polymerase sigma factor n=1 Tax=Solibacillus daqui TaxID=2912187 RepID=UPI0023651108|nr:sigma-70 family RNA polymerase sigma factor [Solibacillus daqui]